MIEKTLKWFAVALVLGANALALHAQMAQDPLLSRTATVEPNIVFLFDDSASMASTAIYQYGTSPSDAGYQGSRGPNGDAECLSITSGSCIWSNPPNTVTSVNRFYGQSPDVNLIYYDPRVTYKERVKADGTTFGAGSTTGISTWEVYFFRDTIAQKVSGVTVSAGGVGYPSTGVTLTLPPPPANGTQATATATVGPSMIVTGINVTAGGAYQTDPNGQAVTIGGPGSGATGTVIASASGSNGITALTGTSYPSGSATSCSVTINTPGAGSGAVITASLPSSSFSRNANITIANPGSGYASTTTVAIKCTGTTRTFTPTLSGTLYSISSVSMTSAGTGYSSVPSVTFPSGLATATGTATTAQTNIIKSVTVNNGGLYAACPATVAISATSGNGAVLTPTCTQVTIPAVNGKWDGTINPNNLVSGKGPISKGDYFTPSYVPDGGSPLAPGADPTVAYPNAASATTTKYPRFRDRTDCANAGYCTWAEERQNYATWKAYHSTRLDLAKTGIGLAFQPLNPTFRLGWGTLGGVSGQGSTSSQCGSSGTAQLTKGVRLYDPTTQSDFLTWLYGINGNVLCTPSRFAVNNVGKYYQRGDDAGPWADSGKLTGDGRVSVAGDVTTHATCRRSYAMLMTDGYYNDNFTGFGDYDSTASTPTTTPQTYKFTPIGPYSDSKNTSTTYSDTFADVAMKYWVTDLRPSLTNGIKAVPSDDAYWQHMNFYSIGLGLVGTLDATDPAVLQSLSGTGASRAISWPTAPAADKIAAIDDMWHASVNGHGKMLNAKTADELNKSVQQMMSDISGKEGTQAGVAVSTISLTKDTRKYTPTYTPIQWTGNITAYNLDQTNANQAAIAWQVETLVSTDPATGWKTYTSRIPSADQRNLFVGTGVTGSGSGTRAIPFTYSAMNTAGILSQMGSTGITTALVNYLRGDPTNEDISAASNSPSAIYRGRQTRLGDIVNSTPVFVKDSVDMKYDTLPTSVTGQSTYAAFVATKHARKEGVLFVGANDGMLHAFRDGQYDSSNNPLPSAPGGVEIFGYVPNALLPSLTKLADKAYKHQYYVDGPNVETDAYLGTKNRWANLVLGSTGGGAGSPSSPGVSPTSAVFAVDVTELNSGVIPNLATGKGGLDASSVLWEVSSSKTGFAELGYVLTDIQAGVTTSGTWVAVFGNGYESKSCTARLFVVNLETGAKLKEIDTKAGDCTTNKNGLGGVRLVRNSQQQVVGAYAGDLLGNMWKFDLTGSSGNWSVDLGGTALFTAGATQPITAPPSIITLPLTGATDPKKGYMVIFGTGKFYEQGDIGSKATQTLYGVWDPQAFDVSPSDTTVPLTDKSKLVQQTISGPLTGTSGNNYYQISTNTVDYANAKNPARGWYIDLPNTGQRNVYPIDMLVNRFAVADTISPSNVSLDPCANTTGGSGWLYIVDGINGQGPSAPVLDTNGDGSVTSADALWSGIDTMADGRNVSIVVRSTSEKTTFANVSGGAPGATIIDITCQLTGTCKPPSTGGTVRHQWRQLFLR